MSNEDLEEARQRLAPLLNVVTKPGTLWHRTSPATLRAILETGAIKPNDGTFPQTYPQSAKCYGWHLGAVCLFDFVTHDVMDALAFSDRWARFFQDVAPAVVAIKIERKALDPALLVGPMKKEELPPRVEPVGQPAYIPMFIPRVEAWYRGDIPATAFREYAVFRRRSSYEHVMVPLSATALDEIERIQREWAQREDDERRAIEARGEVDWASRGYRDRGK